MTESSLDEMACLLDDCVEGGSHNVSLVDFFLAIFYTKGMRWIALLLFFSLNSVQALPLPGTPSLGIFHPETITTVKGEIVRMERIRGAGVHLVLQTTAGELDVHLGPSWYMEGKGIAFRCGESLSVTGSQVKGDGGEVMIATEIKQDEHTILIRHKSGIPLWSRS